SGVAIDIARRRKLTSTLLVPLESDAVLRKSGPEEAVDQKRALELLDGILAKIPEERRVVFVLFELEQVGVHAIPRLLSVPSGTVASRLRKAREEFAASVARLQKVQGR